MVAHPFEDWIGRDRIMEDTVTLDRARKLAATLDLDPDVPRNGGPLPHGWHWIYFHEAVPRSALADDGHERRGDFLPPIPLARRMWAGGRLRFGRALRIGTRVRRVSTVRSVELKQGRSGSLAFVTVEHSLSDEAGVVLEEEQELVYLDRIAEGRGGRPGGARKSSDAEAAVPDWTEPCSLDEVALFRFSALTFNGHRIHYDRPYAVEVEHYPDLVVHGPLLALVLLGAGGRWADALTGRPAAGQPVSFTYRALQPVFCNESIDLCGVASHGSASEHALGLWAAHATRGVVTRAELVIEDPRSRPPFRASEP